MYGRFFLPISPYLTGITKLCDCCSKWAARYGYGILTTYWLVSIFMNESFSFAVEQTPTMSSFEKHEAAMQNAQQRVAELMAERAQPETFICPSGSERACENGWDIAIAHAQAKAEATKTYVGEVEGVDAHQELAAKKLLDYWEAQAELLLRQAELVSRGADLVELQVPVPEQGVEQAA